LERALVRLRLRAGEVRTVIRQRDPEARHWRVERTT
jgi:hypothetical protein